MTPREPDRFEAQARELLDAIKYNFIVLEDVARVAAALRAERENTLQASIDACDDAIGALQGDREVEAALECIKRIRALIAPAPGSPPAPDPFEGHSEAEVYAALDEVRGKAPAADLHGLLIEARRFVSGERWATSAARRALIARIDAALSGPGAAPSKEPPP